MSKKSIPVFRATAAAYINSTENLEMWADLLPGILSVDVFGNRPGIRFSHSGNVRDAVRNPNEVVATRLPFEKLPLMAVFIADAGLARGTYLKVGRSTAIYIPMSPSELPESNYTFGKVRMARETETIPISANVTVTTGGHVSDELINKEGDQFDLPLLYDRCPKSKFVTPPINNQLEAELQAANAKSEQPAKKEEKAKKSSDRRRGKAGGISKLQKKAVKKAEAAKKKLSKSKGKRVA